MKIENQKVDSLDLTFEVAAAGVSIVKIEEGVQKMTNEKSGKTTLRLPLLIEEVIEGPPSNELVKLSHFLPIETDWGEKQLLGILSLTDLLEPMVKKFKGGEVDPVDDTFINLLKLKLPGKMLKATHEVRKDQKGRDQASIVRFERVNGGKSSRSALKGVPAAQSESKDEDW
jgi:hypothetical protein